jgi:hypothetical protein
MTIRRIVKKRRKYFREGLKKLSNILNPAPLIDGLEISDGVIRFVRIYGEELNNISLKLPPGIIVEGRINDKKLFQEALKNLRKQVRGEKGPTHVTVTLPPSVIYTEVFSIPVVSRSKIDETARLNLQMISPIDIEGAYYDYELLGESPTAGGQFELLGAFVGSSLVDDFIGALKEASFIPVAVEFPALSLARLVKHEGLLEEKESYLLVHVANDGVALVILKNGSVYFHHFTYWSVVEAEGGFDEFIVKEIKRVINFYISRCECRVDDLVVITYTMDQAIGEVIIKALPNLNVRSLSLAEFSNTSPIWFVALGAALRGLTPRFKDKSITLTSVGASENYFRSLVLNFIHMWRNIFLGSFAFLIVALFVGDVFLARFSSSLSSETVLSTQPVISGEAEGLLKKAEEFNNLLNLADYSNQQSVSNSTVFDKIGLIAKQNKVSLDRVSFNADQTVLVVGKSDSEGNVLDFKSSINNEPEFGNISLLLTDIKVSPDGTFVFTMTFRVLSFVEEPSSQ